MARQASDADASANHRVAVVGIGAVTGYGWGRKHLQQGLLSGRSAARPVTGFAPQVGTGTLWVARIPENGVGPEGGGPTMAALQRAAHEAVEDARDRGWRAGETVGVVHCLVPDGPTVDTGSTISELARRFGFHGPVVGVSAGTASTVAGILTAKSWIDSGAAHDVVVLNSDLDTSPERCAVLREAGVLAADGPTLERCRPFQQGSAGFAPGEAAVALVLSARSDGACATVLGGAMTFDEPRSNLAGIGPAPLWRAFLEALADAGIGSGDVAYVNAHGTGIPASDAAEAEVLDGVFGGATGIFSVKPLVGHCQTASGAVELYASIYGFETGVIPAPHRVAQGHPRLLDGPTAAADGFVAKASLGMSGHNAVLVLGPAPG